MSVSVPLVRTAPGVDDPDGRVPVDHEAAAVAHLVQGHRPGWSLPAALHHDEAVLQVELDRVWRRSWLFVGTSAQLAHPGDTLTWSVGRESVLLVRGEDGEVRALHNVCRHRGYRLAADGASCGRRSLVCPYHSWAYALDGSLRGAPHMGPDLDTASLGLRPVAVRDVAGLLFVCFDPEPPDLDVADAAIRPQLAPHALVRTVVAAVHSYRVRAGWKLLVENNRECYHCRANHPEFCLSNFEFGVAGDSRTNRRYSEAVAEQERGWTGLGLAPREVSFPGGAPFRVARLPLRDGFETESISGGLVAPPLGALPRRGVGSLRVVSLPNLWAHANADYVMTTRLTPVDAGTTDVEVVFLVRDDAVEGVDYSREELTDVWRATCEQDWELCERNAAGLRSSGYVPGPLSPVTEGSVATFHAWYLDLLSTPRETGASTRTGMGTGTGTPST